MPEPDEYPEVPTSALEDKTSADEEFLAALVDDVEQADVPEPDDFHDCGGPDEERAA